MGRSQENKHTCELLEHDVHLKSTVFSDRVPVKRYRRCLSHSKVGLSGNSPFYAHIRGPSPSRERRHKDKLQEAMDKKDENGNPDPDIKTMWRFYTDMEKTPLSNRDLNKTHPAVVVHQKEPCSVGRKLYEVLTERLTAALESGDEEQLKKVVMEADGKLQIIGIGGLTELNNAKEKLGMPKDRLPDLRSIATNGEGIAPRTCRVRNPTKYVFCPKRRTSVAASASPEKPAKRAPSPSRPARTPSPSRPRPQSQTPPRPTPAKASESPSRSASPPKKAAAPKPAPKPPKPPTRSGPAKTAAPPSRSGSTRSASASRSAAPSRSGSARSAAASRSGSTKLPPGRSGTLGSVKAAPQADTSNANDEEWGLDLGPDEDIPADVADQLGLGELGEEEDIPADLADELGINELVEQAAEEEGDYQGDEVALGEEEDIPADLADELGIDELVEEAAEEEGEYQGDEVALGDLEGEAGEPDLFDGGDLDELEAF